MFGTSRVPPNPQALAAASEGSPDVQLHFNIVIRKAVGVGLGVDIAYSSAAAWTRNGIFIARILEDGILAAWNERSQEPHRVRPGDFIFQVNEVYSDTLSMIQEIKVKQSLTIYVMRVDAPDGLEDIALDGGQDFAAMMQPLMQREIREPEGHDDLLPRHEEAQNNNGANPQELYGGNAGRPAAPPARPRFSPRVEAMLPRLSALSDEALATLISVAVESRPHIRDAIFGNA
mmetsp:Transcript_18489/g.37722  ORF Transcript_18489/g.37722 Transcript_18489/m.37722 type:complete len:232 (-) Transcript_18489:232-927(-)